MLIEHRAFRFLDLSRRALGHGDSISILFSRFRIHSTYSKRRVDVLQSSTARIINLAVAQRHIKCQHNKLNSHYICQSVKTCVRSSHSYTINVWYNINVNKIRTFVIYLSMSCRLELQSSFRDFPAIKILIWVCIWLNRALTFVGSDLHTFILCTYVQLLLKVHFKKKKTI